jgi:drug/metabolite transporter (DMT)-like permease
MHPQRRPRRFPPLWVFLFGLFAVAVLQTWLFPPDEHSVAFNVVFFFAVGAVVVALLTVLERTVKR